MKYDMSSAKNKKEKNPNLKIIIAVILLAIIGVVLFAIFSWPPIMPDVVGSTREEAIQILEKKGFVISVQEEYSDTVAEGIIISQGIEKGTKLYDGAYVAVTASIGKQPIIEHTEGDDMKQNPIATIKIKDRGEVKVELYPDIAPNTVANFIELANSGYYDGLIFHRIIDGFMVQGGCPDGTGRGNPGYSIYGEFSSNGFTNDLKHTEGVISMARSSMPNSAGSQFFIMVSDYPSLDGQYAAFGKVIEGYEIVKEMGKVSTDGQDRPYEDQVMESVTIETFGVEYPAAQKQ